MDLNQICQIESRVHRAPWGREVFNHCLWLNYRCRVIIPSKQETNAILGYCISRLMNTSHHILNLAIDLPHQRKGFAHILLDELIDEISDDDTVEQCVLEVRPSNIAALNLYEQYGFKQKDIKQNYYIDEGNSEDALILSRPVNH